MTSPNWMTLLDDAKSSHVVVLGQFLACSHLQLLALALLNDCLACT